MPSKPLRCSAPRSTPLPKWLPIASPRASSPEDEADNIFICCGVFIHWEATTIKIQDYNYRAVKEAIARAVAGDPKPAEVVAKRDVVKHPFAA